MTIHHTASPANDGGDPARRMRQIQAFHIDNRGWCDIGYHFVVSQSGKIYQGRSTEKRTGAHVGGENTGNIGIAHIGNFKKQMVGKTQFKASTKIVHWVHSTYNISLDKQHVKGHTQWPNQSTSCPGTNMLSRLGELRRRSRNPGSSGSKWDVEIDAKVVGDPNPYDQGSSRDIPDAFPGEKRQVSIIITNKSDRSLRNVWLGYALDPTHLKPNGYEIFDDHPKHDRKSWNVNSADSASENPKNLGSSGKLFLQAFSSGESKRIQVDLKAKQYSLGAGRHPDVKSWIRQIRDAYEKKTGWKDTPSTDKVGKNLRDRAKIDIPSRDEWRFENEETPENLEGWTACCSDDFDRFAVNRKEGAMAIEVTGPNPRLRSPEWTRVDADRYGELVLRFRAHDGSHPVAVYWKRSGESYDSGRTFRFRAPGDETFHTFVVPLRQHEKWSGNVTGIRIDPLDSGEVPSENATGWYDVDGLYFRSKNGTTSTRRDEYPNPEMVERLDRPESGPDGSNGMSDAGANGLPGPDAGSQSDASRSGGFASDEVRVKGCMNAGRGGPLPVGLLLFASAGLVFWRRRKECGTR